MGDAVASLVDGHVKRVASCFVERKPFDASSSTTCSGATHI
jgi:hypothetical protein